MHTLQFALHHLCLGSPSSWCPMVDEKCLAFECSAFFALNIRQRTFECTIRMLLAKGPRTWGSGVSTRLAGCACCWHIWKNFSYHTGKYIFLFFFFFPLQFSSAVSINLQNLLEKYGSLFLLYAGLHTGWQSVPAVCYCISSTGRGQGSESSSPAAPWHVILNNGFYISNSQLCMLCRSESWMTKLHFSYSFWEKLKAGLFPVNPELNLSLKSSGF